MKMSKEEFVEKISKLELSEDRANLSYQRTGPFLAYQKNFNNMRKNTSCALRYSTN